MIRATKDNTDEISTVMSSIAGKMEEWQIVIFKLPVRGEEEQQKILLKLLGMYKDTDGLLFSVKNYKIVMVARMGVVANYGVLKSDIGNRISEHDCRIVARKMSVEGLKQIQADISAPENDQKSSLYEDREGRKENVFLVCDDDMFVRKSLVKFLTAYGRVEEVEDGEGIRDAYVEHNPDMVLLDIHMPGKSGLESVNDLIALDTDAFIVMISADSSKDNVLEAISCGSVGFLSKPVRAEKLDEFRAQCITLS